MQRTGRLLFLQHQEGRGAAPWRPSKAWPPLPVWGADGYQMAGEEGRRGPVLSLFFALSWVHILIVLFASLDWYLQTLFVLFIAYLIPVDNCCINKEYWKVRWLWTCFCWHRDNFFFFVSLKRYVIWGMKDVAMTHLWSVTHWRIVYFESLLLMQTLFEPAF